MKAVVFHDVGDIHLSAAPDKAIAAADPQGEPCPKTPCSL